MLCFEAWVVPAVLCGRSRRAHGCGFVCYVSAVSDALEAELDRLFQLPLAALVEARKALVDRLRRGGDKAGAARIAGVKRATAAAWALNQVHFRSPVLLERARADVEALRELHARDGVSGLQLTAAGKRQRASAQAVVEAALACCRAADLPGGASQQRRIFGTLQGWLTGAADEAPGRLTRDLELSGFDAVTVVGEVARATPSEPPPSAASAPAPVPALESAELSRAKHELAVYERAALRAAEACERLAPALERALRERERAQVELNAAEQRLNAARQLLADREAALVAADAALTHARDAQTQAGRELDAARARVAR
jgi:hypothetical protein